MVPLVPSQDLPGPIARSIEDIALVLSVIAGADVRDTASLEMPHAVQPAEQPRETATIRIGVPRRTIADRPISQR